MVQQATDWEAFTLDELTNLVVNIVNYLRGAVSVLPDDSDLQANTSQSITVFTKISIRFMTTLVGYLNSGNEGRERQASILETSRQGKDAASVLISPPKQLTTQQCTLHFIYSLPTATYQL